MSQGPLPERPRPWEGGRLSLHIYFLFVGLTWTRVSGVGSLAGLWGTLPLPALTKDTQGYHGAWTEPD